MRFPLQGPLDRPSPGDLFLLDLAAIEWAARDHHQVISRVGLAATQATVRIMSLTEEDGAAGDRERWFGPLPLDAGRELLLDGLISPAGLPEPRPWEPMPYIPAGRPNWREHWAQLLVDLAQYGWFLREGPFPLPDPLRYECIELLGLANRRPRRQAVVVVSDQGGQRWVTRVALPPPLRVDLTAAPLTIREWISEGTGHVLGDGSTAKQLGG